VRKGLETPLLIRGLQVRYYYLMGGIIAVLALFLLTAFLGLTKTMTLASFSSFAIKVLISGSICTLSYVYLSKKSRVVKYRFKGKLESTISNRDIFQYL